MIGILRPSICVDILIKHLRQQGPNERVERQARVKFYASPCEPKKGSDALTQVDVIGLLIGTTGLAGIDGINRSNWAM